MAVMNIAQARHKLDLSLSQFAALHQMSTAAVRRWEQPQDATGYREPSGSAKAFTQALLEGYRPGQQDSTARYEAALREIVLQGDYVAPVDGDWHVGYVVGLVDCAAIARTALGDGK